jgi:hypothetical protein
MRASAPRPAGPPGEPKDGRAPLPPEALEFLSGVVTPCEPLDLQGLPGDDRIFLSGILRKVNENRLEIPVLPRAALEISRLLANPDSNLTEFVRILNDDPALSVDVLRAANSAYYGFSAPARSIRDALARVGVGQIRALLVVAHLKGKVLKGGSFQKEAGWLSELSSTLAAVGKTLAPHLGLTGDEADDLLARDAAEDPVARPYAGLRGAVVASWAGQEPAPIEGIPPGELRAAIAGCGRG